MNLKFFSSGLLFPIISAGLISIAIGLLNTLLPIKMHTFNEEAFSVGIITSLYYVGFFIACFTLTGFIKRNGYERSFIAFAAILAIFSLIQGLHYNKTVWSICRIFQGFGLAGIYMAIESWLLSYSTPKNKGKVLSVYMVALYGMQALGQYLVVLEKFDILPFCIANLLIILAILPLSVTPKSTSDIIPHKHITFKKIIKKSPMGMYFCILSGIMIAVIYGLIPLYLKEFGRKDTEVAVIMSLTILGGMSLQFPLGYLSDIFDKKIVLRLLCILLSLVITAIILCELYLEKQNFYINLLMFIFGGITFTIYPISMSKICDSINSEEIVDATRHMLLVYVLGSILGPVLMSAFMTIFSDIAIYGGFIIIALAGFALTFLREKPLNEEEGDFVTVTVTTPFVAELDPRGEE